MFNMSRIHPILPAICASAMLVGCGQETGNKVVANNMAEPVTVENISDPDSMTAALVMNEAVSVSSWAGRWNGPEGLFLDIQPSPDGKAGHFAIANKDNLDREANYDGVAQGDTIRFTRDGKDMTIRAGSGDQTGFKYLAGKTDCLIVIAGQEGYCRS